LPRSSIVVSDEPLSKETNYRTEFVAVLNNQPQGGFITRRPTPVVDVMASDNGWGDSGFGFFFQRGPDPQAGNPQMINPQNGNARRRGGPYYNQQAPQGWNQQPQGWR